MPCAHRVGDQRMCGATTVSAGLNTNVFVNGVLAAVAGDLNDHGLLGALISQSPGTIKINGIPMIASIMDQGSPDVIGLITHVTGLPTPGTGSPNVNMYTGNFAGGLGNFGLSGIPGVGELMSFAGNIVGQVSRNAVQGGQSGMLAMSNMNPSVTQPTANSTIVSANTGKTFTFTSYYNNNGIVAGPVGLQVIPGNTSFTSAGTYNFLVPNYNTITVTVDGAGAGGVGGSYIQTTAIGYFYYYGQSGTDGGASTFGNLITAQGGLKTPVNNNSNINNDAYSIKPSSVGYDTGGSGGTVYTGQGGQGGAGGQWIPGGYSNRGGHGGRVINSWSVSSPNAPVVGQTVPLTVGSGGTGGSGSNGAATGGQGSTGSVSISWT